MYYKTLSKTVFLTFVLPLFLLVFSASSCVTTGADSYSTNGDVVTGSPTISSQFIENILTTNGSPAKGTGYALYSYGVQYGIDPAFALAFFLHESSYGKYGVASSSLSLGNLRCISNARCVNSFAYFDSWQAGYAAWYQLISGPYYVGSGLTTVGQITQKYAPSADGNNPYSYAQAVESTVQSWRAVH